MAFSGSSYFFGIGTAFAAIAVGFAGGAMVTTSAVQPPNRLERVAVGTVAPSDTPQSSEQPNTAKPASPETPPVSAPAAAPPAQAADPQAAPQPAASVAATSDKADTKTVQERPAPAFAAKSPPAAPVAKSDEAPAVKSERITIGRAPDPGKDVSRSADPNREIARKRAEDRRSSDDRRFSDRRRRQDQQDQDQRRLDEATNVVRQMPRSEAIEDVRARPRRFEVFEDDDEPRVINGPPPRFGFFGD